MKRFTDRKWVKPTEKRRSSMSAKCFLDGADKKYPVKHTPDGAYYVHALVSAYRLSNMYDNQKVHEKAGRLLRAYQKEKR